MANKHNTVEPKVAFILGMMDIIGLSNKSDKNMDLLNELREGSERKFDKAVVIDREMLDSSDFENRIELISESLSSEQVWVLVNNMIEAILIETKSIDLNKFILGITAEEHANNRSTLFYQLTQVTEILDYKFGENNEEVHQKFRNVCTILSEKNNMDVF